VFFICASDFKLQLELNNQFVESAIVSKNKVVLNRIQVSYIDECLNRAGFGPISSYMRKPLPESWSQTALGVDETGNLCVTTKRNLDICIENTSVNRMSAQPYAALDNSYVSILPGLRYSVKSELDSDRKYICKTFDINPSDIIKVLRILYNNDYNIRKMDSKYTEFNDFLDVVVGDVSEVEMKVDKDQLINNYKISKLYKIMKKARDTEYINFNNNKLRATIYPAQEGGLLSCMVHYKEKVEDFRFNPNIIITPELMYLKSTQPEAFMSEMATNLIQKYNSLYTETDKYQIIQSLNAIRPNELSEEEMTSRLIQLMTIWGYVGVMGSLENYTQSKGEDRLKAFYVDTENKNLINLSLYMYRALVEALITAFDQLNVRLVDTDLFCLPKTVSELKMFLMSYTHDYSLTAFSVAASSPYYVVNISDMILGILLEQLLSYNEYRSKLNEELATQPLLSNIDFMTVKPYQLRQTISMMLMNVTFENKQNYEIMMGDRGLNLPDKIIPYVKTREILEEIIKFSVSKIHYFGIYNTAFVKYYSQTHKIVFNNKLYVFEPEYSALSDNFVVFNSQHIFERPLDDDFLESDDYYELSAEMEYKDFPPSILDDYPPVFKKKYDRRVFISNSDRYKGATLYKVNFINGVGMLMPNGLLQRSRQVGETLVIITDKIHKELVDSENEKFKFFKPNMYDWYDKTMLSPESLLYIVWDSNKINVKLWELYLDCKCVSLNQYLQIADTNRVTEFRDNTGHLTEDFFNDPDMEELISRLRKQSLMLHQASKTVESASDKVEEKKEIILSEASKKIKELKEINPDLIFIKKYESLIHNSYKVKGDLTVDDITSIVVRLMEGEESRKQLFGSVNKALQSVSDSSSIDKIWQIPGVFSMGRPSESDLRNRALKDSGLRAEIESVGKNLANKILSGTLKISKKQRASFTKHIKLCRGYMRGVTKNRFNKNFMIDLYVLINNDAMNADDKNDDDIFENMMLDLTNFIIEEDEDASSDDDLYSEPADQGFLKYKPMFM